MRNLFALPERLWPDKLLPDRLSKGLLSNDTIENYKKPVIIIGGVVGTLVVGTLVVRKIYFNKINELVDETQRRENERAIKVQSDAAKPIGLVREQQQQSNSVPATPNEPRSPGLSVLMDQKGQQSNSLSTIDRVSLNSHLTRRGKPRNLNSICSHQMNVEIDHPVELVMFSTHYVKRALKLLEDLRARNREFEVQNSDEFEGIILDVKALIERINSFGKNSQAAVEQQQNVEAEGTPPFGSPEGSISSTLYTIPFFDTEPNIHFFKLYTNSLDNLDTIVRPRQDRSEMVNCETAEFYAKVNCIRNGFQAIFANKEHRDYFAGIGEYILKVLVTNEREQQECLTIYRDLIEFVTDEENFDTVNEELATRNIPLLSFYDLVLDYIILDSFEDLQNPPASVVTVVNQRWFGDTFKIKALQTAIAIMLKHKRNKLRVLDGFFSRFYCLMERVSWILAWGFFGTDTDLKLKCNFIKQAIFEVVRDFFDFDRVRYTSLHDLTIDMMAVVDIRYEDLQTKISIIT